jgi:hypothetical protein
MMNEKCYRNMKLQAGKPAYMKDVASLHNPITSPMNLHRLIGDGRRLDWEYCSTTSRVERLTASVARLSRVAMLPQDAHYMW